MAIIMISPLFSILSHLNGNTNRKVVSIAGKNYSFKTKVAAENSARFHILSLTQPREVIVSGMSFDSVDQHMTFFETQKETEGYRSAYHYTTILENRHKKGPNHILIHLYFNRFDQVCMSLQVWSYDIEKSCKVAPVNELFSEHDKKLFINTSIDFIMPLIIELRKQQQRIVHPLKEEYQRLSAEMVGLSQHQTATWDPNNKIEFLDRLNQSLPVLKSLCLYSDQTENFEAVIRIYLGYKRVLLREDIKHVVESDSFLDETKAEPLLSEIAYKDERVIDELRQIDNRLKFLISRSKTLIASKLVHKTDAMMLETCLQQLDHAFNTSKFSENDTFEILGAMLAIRQALTSYCIEQIMAGDVQQASSLYQYIMEIPMEVIEHCIKTDNGEMLESLLNHEKISVNTSLSNENTVSSFIIEHEREHCLLVLLKKNVSLLAIYSRLFLNVYNEGQADMKHLETLLSKLIRVGAIITRRVSYEMTITMLENNIRFLTEMLNKPTNQLIKRKGKRAQNTTDDATHDLLKCLIEVTKPLKFLIISMTEIEFEHWRAISLDEQSKHLITPAKLDIASLLDFNSVLPCIKEILPLLESFNQQLEYLSEKNKKELKNILLPLLNACYDLSKGRPDYARLTLNVSNLFSFFIQHFTLPANEILKLKSIFGMNPTDEFEPFISSVLSTMLEATGSLTDSVANSINLAPDSTSMTHSQFFRYAPRKPDNCIGWCQPPDGSYEDETGTHAPTSTA
jgi:hypothetical protein